MSVRNIEKHIRYNMEEWETVCGRAAALGQKPGKYIRDISVNGKIITYDMKQFTNLIIAFNRIGNEINQITRVINSTKSVYQKDVDELKDRFEELDRVFQNYLRPIRSGELNDNSR